MPVEVMAEIAVMLVGMLSKDMPRPAILGVDTLVFVLAVHLVLMWRGPRGNARFAGRARNWNGGRYWGGRNSGSSYWYPSYGYSGIGYYGLGYGYPNYGYSYYGYGYPYYGYYPYRYGYWPSVTFSFGGY
jgi:hypothetical protein